MLAKKTGNSFNKRNSNHVKRRLHLQEVKNGSALENQGCRGTCEVHSYSMNTAFSIEFTSVI